MTTLMFEITFHGPFRVSTGGGSPGVDATPDATDWLPGSSLKGRMAASARDLGVGFRLREEVFGTPRSPSPWSWRSADFSQGAVLATRTRIRISPLTGTAQKGALFVGDEVWAHSATFTIEQMGSVQLERAEVHERVLVVAAAGIRSLGASRTRGLGWVGITARGRAVTASDLTVIQEDNP